MVPLDPSRLRTAVDLSGQSVARLAQRMGRAESRQTLHHLLSGDKATRCRRWRRRRLAKLLEVSETYLAGEPLEFEWASLAHYELMRRWSPRMALAYHRLVERCQEAVRRDLSHYRAEPDTGEEWNASEHVRFYMSWAVGQLVTPHVWRDRLLREQAAARPLTRADRDMLQGTWTLDSIERVSEAEETAALSLIRGWDYVLLPWYRDKAALNYAEFEHVVASASRGARVFSPRCERPSVIVRDDGQRFSPSDPATPYCVLRWPSNANGEAS